MGFFGNSTASSANIEDLLREENLPMYEGMSSIMEACYAGIAETEMNWNAIMEAAAETEMNYFAENGEEYVYTEASGFGSKVVEFFKKIWEKIKGLFKKFLVMIGSMTAKDKDFVKKYGETIRRNMKNIPADAKFKGYEFENVKTCPTESALNGVLNEILEGKKDAAFKFSADDYESSEANDQVRGLLFKAATNGSEANRSDSEFRSDLVEHYKGDSKDIPMNSVTVANALSEIESAKTTKKNAEDLFDNCKRAFNKSIKTAEKKESKGYSAKKGEEGHMEADALKVLNRQINAAKAGANAIQILCAVYLQCVKEYYAQQRKICVKVVTYKNVKEGATVEHFAEGAFGRVSLI